jgi:cytochrome c oxidase assembly protein subunit 15
MTVGALILVLAAVSWRESRREGRRLPFSLAWPLLTLVWVVVQGLFGKYTVTLKLYPAVVTLHLLGGLTLLGLLAAQHQAYRQQPLALPAGLRGFAVAALLVLTVQLALGGWVSSNYAVLACSGFPQCNGSWWPAADFAGGFTLLRELGGVAAHGRPLTAEGLVAIHLAHRGFAVVVALTLGLLAWRLRQTSEPVACRFGTALAWLLLAQVLTGLSNVVLGWPLLAALAHTAGAAGLVLTLALLLARSASRRRAAAPMGQPAAA